MDKAAVIKFVITMFALLNPIGSVALFAGLVAGRSAAERRSIAINSSIAVGVILVSVVWVGESVMELFGIGIYSLQVAGGIMIAMISIAMLKSKQSAIHDSKGDVNGPKPDIAVVPLAMPIIAGPGAIIAVIVTAHQHMGIASNIEMSVVCAGLAGMMCLCLLLTPLITRILGTRGLNILTKFMGMLLLAIAVGMFATGLKGLLPGLAG